MERRYRGGAGARFAGYNMDSRPLNLSGRVSGHDSVVPTVYEPRLPPERSPALLHQATLFRPRVYLDALRRHHLELVKRFLALDPGIFSLDLFITALARRSYHLVDGFVALFDEWNVISAAPILRLQLDNLTRLSYVCRAPRADEVADAVIKGVEFRHMRDADGKTTTGRPSGRARR